MVVWGRVSRGITRNPNRLPLQSEGLTGAVRSYRIQAYVGK